MSTVLLVLQRGKRNELRLKIVVSVSYKIRTNKSSYALALNIYIYIYIYISPADSQYTIKEYVYNKFYLFLTSTITIHFTSVQRTAAKLQLEISKHHAFI